MEQRIAPQGITPQDRALARNDPHFAALRGRSTAGGHPHPECPGLPLSGAADKRPS
jgi:hypothetical protein